MMSARQATLRDVAALAGVSTKTVSNVIAGRIFVRPGTQERVQQAVEELRYSPNAMARCLRLGTVHMIGLVLPDLQDARYSAFADAVITNATGQGLTVIIYTTRDASAGNPAASMRMGYDLAQGLILCSDRAQPYALDPTWKPRPRVDVSLSKSARSPEADEAGTTRTRSHVVAADPTAAGHEAVEILADLLTPRALRT